MKTPQSRKPVYFLAILTPGILTAMTGVGAGDLATASFAGNKLGLAILWAVVVGAVLKYILSEGLTRWQLATGTTLLEGCIEHLKIPFLVFFVLYFFPWSYFVGAALINACGVTMSSMVPGMAGTVNGKVIFGILHSILGVVLVRYGSYRMFSKVMQFFAGLLFVSIIWCAAITRPDLSAVLQGIFHPGIPQLESGGLLWTIALMGGVGGTLTILCYGYWIHAEGRKDLTDLNNCKIDLVIGYGLTALFGMSMVIIGSNITVNATGINLVIGIADYFTVHMGTGAKWLFLFGAWGAVFSSLLGVWQCVPQIFADCYYQIRRKSSGIHSHTGLESSKAFRVYLYLLASVPLLSLVSSFKEVQKLYAIVGALFIPCLAAVLLYLNGNTKLIGRKNRNSLLTSLVLLVTLCFFLFAGWMQI